MAGLVRSRRSLPFAFASTFALAALAGCGSSATEPTTHPSQSSGTAPGSSDNSGSSTTNNPGTSTPTPDNGSASTSFPAFTPDMPAVQNNGGGVLATPEIVTIVYPDDPNADAYESIASKIGASDYWAKITSEYGIGAATSPAADHIRMTQPLGAKIQSTEIEKIITDNVDNASSGFPAFSPSRIYTVFIPATTKVYEEGQTDDDCTQGAGGYHDQVQGKNGEQITYAVVLMCEGMTLADATLSASHEWNEASTDPLPQTKPGYVGLDAQHLAYDLFVEGQDEVGDMCEFDDDQEMTGEADLPFTVQRQWSNKSAAAGHAPCVPGAQKTYWNTVALNAPKDDVTYDLTVLDPTYGAMEGKGYKLAVGDKMTIPFGVYSDGQMDAAQLTVAELDMGSDGSINPVANGKNVKLSLDKSSGVNGEKANLTIERVAKAPTDSHLVVVISTANGIQHYMPILIGDADSASKVQSGSGPMMRRVHRRLGRASRVPRFGGR